jgi:tryptophan-rich sensory protein
MTRLGPLLRLDQIAAWCAVPLPIWVAFATALSFAIGH